MEEGAAPFFFLVTVAIPTSTPDFFHPYSVWQVLKVAALDAANSSHRSSSQQKKSLSGLLSLCGSSTCLYFHKHNSNVVPEQCIFLLLMKPLEI